ncbi:fluoride efflux transporter CrcB [Desulfoscipio gibsoniae]
MIDVAAVGVGGFLGAVSRYLVVRMIAKVWRGDFPLGTFVVNMLGSFALGLLVAYPYFAVRLMGGSARVAIGVGFVGSFTTYSTFMYESFMLGKRGKVWLGFAYVLASVAMGLFLAWLAVYCL